MKKTIDLKNLIIAVLVSRWIMTMPIWYPDAFELVTNFWLCLLTFTGIIYYMICDFEGLIQRLSEDQDTKVISIKEGARHGRN